MVGKKIIDLKNDISDLEEKNSNLKDFIANFKKEEYIEKEAKARLNLKNPGEKVIVIIEEEVKKTGDDLKGKSNALKDLWQSIKNTLDWWK
jgi:cell division protein FtsB